MKHARPDYDRIQDPAGLIPEDEPVFLLRAQDKHFIRMLREYARCIATDGGDLRMISMLDNHIALAQAWPNRKAPDLPK